MPNRDFNKWFATFQTTNRTFSYWVNFEKVLKNADSVKVELNILNSLIGSRNIEKEFIEIIRKYPECLKCIPLLLAIRSSEIEHIEGIYKFTERSAQSEFFNEQSKYIEFMDKTGLFAIMQNRTVKNLYDYVVGIEVGLDTNARKNRGGALMARIVSDYFDDNGIAYEKELTTVKIEKNFGIDLSPITNSGKSIKRFDFVVHNGGVVYGIEVNFYSSQGSKLNETARSYKEIAVRSRSIPNFEFVWITDGVGWKGAKNNLQETFDNFENIYNISDLQRGEFYKQINK